MHPIDVGIAGLGNVGREAARLLMARAADFRRQAGAPLRLAWVCDRDAVREARRLGLPASVKRAARFEAMLQDGGPDVVVELFGGDSDARRLVLAALAKGRHVVTANKHLLSCHWEEVMRAGARHNRQVRFEGSVAGAIPILEALRGGLSATRIGSLLGIVNGTTNFILSRMAHEGLSLEQALREARRLGLAERDASLDLSGADSAHKLSILASLLTGGWVKPSRVRRAGIEPLEPGDLRFAVSRLKRTLRLVGTLKLRWGARPSLEAHVQPTLLPLEHPLAAVHGGYNALLVDASPAGDLMFYGKGAGPGPAASAVLGDLILLARDILAGRAKPDSLLWAGKTPFADAEESAAPFYFRLAARDKPGALAAVAGAFSKRGVSIAQMHQEEARPASGGAAPIALVTHPAARAAVDAVLGDLRRLGAVAGKPAAVRILPEAT